MVGVHTLECYLESKVFRLHVYIGELNMCDQDNNHDTRVHKSRNMQY